MKRPPAVPVFFIGDVKFYRKVNFEKLSKSGGQNLVSTKKCLMWNPNILHKELMSSADDTK